MIKKKEEKDIFCEIKSAIEVLVNQRTDKIIIYPYGKMGHIAEQLLSEKGVTYIVADHYKCVEDNAIYDIDVFQDEQYREYKILICSDINSAHYEDIRNTVFNVVKEKQRIIDIKLGKKKNTRQSSKFLETLRFRNKIWKEHVKREEKYICDRGAKRYYIIRYSDPQSSGWTVFERVVLYGSIYAHDHKMIPVVDMKNYRNIYQEEDECGKVNIWERYYYQPGRVSLEEALKSNNYILGDPSWEWFSYVRKRKPRKFTEEYLREQYQKYVCLLPEVSDICEERLRKILPNGQTASRLLGIKLRGTDYLQYHHPMQPNIKDITKLARDVFEKYQCDYYFISTEDHDILKSLTDVLPRDKVITYNSGNVEYKSGDGFLGEHIRKTMSAHDASLTYLTTLYILNKCSCLIGGICGATIVAKYRRSEPYEYIEIIDTKMAY